MRGRAAPLPLVNIRPVVAKPGLLPRPNLRLLLLLPQRVAQLAVRVVLRVLNRLIERLVEVVFQFGGNFLRIVQPIVPDRGHWFFFTISVSFGKCET